MTIRVPFNVPFIVFVLLLLLKLTGVVAWPWWIITMPLWLPLALIVALIGFTLLVFMAALTLTLVVGR